VTVLPTATFSAPATAEEGQPFTLTLSNAQVPGHPDVTAFTYAFDCGDGPGYAPPSSTASRSCPTSSAGSRSVKGKVIDPDLDQAEYTATVEITNNTSPTVPAAPTNLGGAAASPTQANLGWSDNSGNETHFQLQRRTRNPDGTWGSYALLASPAANTTAYLDAAVNPGTTYRYRLRACNGTTCSVWSNERPVGTPWHAGRPTGWERAARFASVCDSAGAHQPIDRPQPLVSDVQAVVVHVQRYVWRPCAAVVRNVPTTDRSNPPRPDRQPAGTR
jgi:hypothetical protein